ncbi:MAG: glycoside hydrolase family 65 protein, partial [Spirochaeta sp.]|nr:glycoside hydrolase family 65 protein [Spirochaeta sp.]
ISGDSGEEICPSYFFKDVLSGRRIRNHFNDWQIHISPDIAYTIWMYVTVTDDTEYLRRYGAEIVFEIARFLVSRSHFRKDRNGYDVIRVLGPDEYHENVDNNFFTNFQFRFAAEYAVSLYNWMAEHAPDELSAIVERIGLAEGERADWRDLAERIVLPAPDEETQIIEQFEGYFDLEDTRPEVIRERLLDPGEYWGWPNGIAVETQVTKQADVTQLFVLYPREYPRSVMSANWEYYEPRTQHGSSLSPAVYAIVAAWVGRLDHAYRYFLKSCTIDLYNDNKAVSGGTFIGGIHTAAAGISWQVVVSGFAGMYLTDGGFGFRPHLPNEWQRLSVAVQRRGAGIDVTVQLSDVAAAYTVTCAADAENPIPLEITVGDTTRSVAPGASVPFQIQM